MRDVDYFFKRAPPTHRRRTADATPAHRCLPACMRKHVTRAWERARACSMLNRCSGTRLRHPLTHCFLAPGRSAVGRQQHHHPTLLYLIAHSHGNINAVDTVCRIVSQSGLLLFCVVESLNLQVSAPARRVRRDARVTATTCAPHALEYDRDRSRKRFPRAGIPVFVPGFLDLVHS